MEALVRTKSKRDFEARPESESDANEQLRPQRAKEAEVSATSQSSKDSKTTSLECATQWQIFNDSGACSALHGIANGA